MRIVITGSDGMLGTEIVWRLKRNELVTTIPLNHHSLNIISKKDVINSFTSYKPKLVINCAAYNLVDRAQTEPTKVNAVNNSGVLNIAETCDIMKIPLIHFSTDYIFGGGGMSYRQYKEDDPPTPANLFGQSKYLGEESIRENLREHLIIRSSWFFASKGRNFVKTIYNLTQTKNEIRMVKDQYGRPTYVGDIADIVVMLVNKIFSDKEPEWGTYHYGGKDILSRYEYTLEIINQIKKLIPLKDLTIVPITTSEYPLPANRPAWAVLDCNKIISTFGVELKDFRIGLEKVLKDMLT